MLDTLLRLRVFVAVYEERSFTGAALRENATQSGITQHIQKLEQYHGVKLFRRGTGSGSVVPTPAAEAYYESCIRVLRAHEQSRSVVKPYGAGLEGEIVIGLTPTITRAAFGAALARFLQEQPNVQVRVVDAYSDIIIDKLRLGELDFGIVPGGQDATGLVAEPFASSPEFLVSGPNSRLGLQPGEPVRLAELGPLNLVLPSRAQPRRDYLERYFAAVGAPIARRLEIDSSLGQFDFVAKTAWVAIHPAIMLMEDLKRHDFVINPLIRPQLSIELFRLERARQPPGPAAAAFLAVLQDEIRALSQRAATLQVAAGASAERTDAAAPAPR